jgi:regulator of protease activity HflC (stomatin/prohibitin superfamily)
MRNKNSLFALSIAVVLGAAILGGNLIGGWGGRRFYKPPVQTPTKNNTVSVWVQTRTFTRDNESVDIEMVSLYVLPPELLLTHGHVDLVSSHVSDSVKDVASRYNANQIRSKRKQFASDITKQLNEKLESSKITFPEGSAYLCNLILVDGKTQPTTYQSYDTNITQFPYSSIPFTPRAYLPRIN